MSERLIVIVARMTNNYGSREIRRPKIDCLLELAHEKSVLEERIEKCQSELEQAFLSTAQQFQVALTGRIEELAL